MLYDAKRWERPHLPHRPPGKVDLHDIALIAGIYVISLVPLGIGYQFLEKGSLGAGTIMVIVGVICLAAATGTWCDSVVNGHRYR